MSEVETLGSERQRLETCVVRSNHRTCGQLPERTFAWLNQFRELRVRYEKRADIHEAFLSLGCVLI